MDGKCRPFFLPQTILLVNRLVAGASRLHGNIFLAKPFFRPPALSRHVLNSSHPLSDYFLVRLWNSVHLLHLSPEIPFKSFSDATAGHALSRKEKHDPSMDQQFYYLVHTRSTALPDYILKLFSWIWCFISSLGYSHTGIRCSFLLLFSDAIHFHCM